MICDFDDFCMNIENKTIKISGYIKVKLSKNKVHFVNRSSDIKMKESFSAIIFSDFIKIIVDNFKSPNDIKKLLCEHLENIETEYYKVLSYKIVDVYNVQKRERKLKLEKINKLS